MTRTEQTKAIVSEGYLMQTAIKLNSSVYWRNKYQGSPEYLKHRIEHLEREVEKWKDEYYRARRAYEEATGKAYCTTANKKR